MHNNGAYTPPTPEEHKANERSVLRGPNNELRKYDIRGPFDQQLNGSICFRTAVSGTGVFLSVDSPRTATGEQGPRSLHYLPRVDAEIFLREAVEWLKGDMASPLVSKRNSIGEDRSTTSLESAMVLKLNDDGLVEISIAKRGVTHDHRVTIKQDSLKFPIYVDGKLLSARESSRRRAQVIVKGILDIIHNAPFVAPLPRTPANAATVTPTPMGVGDLQDLLF